MVGKEHSKLIRDIRTYISYLAEAKIGLGDFFIESTYTNSQNKELPNYLLTKKEAWHFESKEKAMLLVHKFGGKVTIINKGYL